MHFIFLTALYLVFAEHAFAIANVVGVMLVVASLAFYGASAVLANDYFDIPSDKASGKKRAIYDVSLRYILLLFASMTFLGFTLLILIGDPLLIFLYLATYVLALSYSAPPLRFKGRGYMSLIVDVIVEKPLPVLLLFTYFGRFGADTLVFVLLAFATHATIQVRHQLEDYGADASTGTQTFAVKVGYERASRLLYDYLFPISAALGVSVLFLFAFTLPFLVLALVLAPVGYVLVVKLKALNLFSEDRDRIPEWHKKDAVPMPLYFSYTFMWVTSLLPIVGGALATVISVCWLPLFLIIVASQYYYFHLHYLPLLRGCMSLAKRIVGLA